jgi:predicted nuclease with TOPRIM domain
MTRTNKSQSVQSTIRRLQNQVANLQAQQEEQSTVEVVRQNFQNEARIERLRVERNRLRARIANLEGENEELRRRVEENNLGFSFAEVFFVSVSAVIVFFFCNKFLNF